MSQDGAQGDTAAELSGNDTARVSDDADRAKDDGEASVDQAAVALERIRRQIQRQREAVDDAEEICVYWVNDALDGLFQEMQATAENAVVITRTAAWATNSVFEGVVAGAMEVPRSLDRSRVSTSTGSRQQTLRVEVESEEGEHGGNAIVPNDTTSCGPSLQSLRRLVHFFETSAAQVKREMFAFPAARFVERTTNTPGGGAMVMSSDWELPNASLIEFLERVVARCHVRVLPSAVAFVRASNAALINSKSRSKVRLTQSQVVHCLRKAVLNAEDALAAQAKLTLSSAGAEEGVKLLSKQIHANEPRLVSCFQEELLPSPPVIDRNVPGRLARKNTGNATAVQKQLARKVLMMFKPASKISNRWLSLRTKVVGSNSNVVKVSINAHLEMKVGQSTGSGSKPPPPPKKPPARMSMDGSQATGRAGGRPSVLLSSMGEPDTATLSNIFALGTPRQMSGAELARRNDILSLLERQEQQSQRRAANASIAAMSLQATTCPSEAEEKQFRAYVAANSSIISGVDFHIPDPAMAEPTALMAPKRPDQRIGNPSPHRRESAAVGGRTKLEIEREPPSFAISDGNAHARGDLNTVEKAMCSPIRRVRGTIEGKDGLNQQQQSSVVAGNAMPSPIRPVQSPPTAQLPQLDTSRLAVGVRAVVRGVEKNGPRRSPSRQSRLKLHNYNMDDEDSRDHSEHTATTESAMHSPIRPSAFAAQSPSSSSAHDRTHLPMIPPVSPIAASPTRKRVVFIDGDGAKAKAPPSVRKPSRTQPAKDADESSPPHARLDQRPARQKQVVFDKKTASPPRVRNRHFMSNKYKTQGRDHDGRVDNEPDDNIFAQPMAAPRRSLLPSQDY